MTTIDHEKLYNEGLIAKIYESLLELYLENYIISGKSIQTETFSRKKLLMAKRYMKI